MLDGFANAPMPLYRRFDFLMIVVQLFSFSSRSSSSQD
jgi:hypothetical protein